VPKRFASTAGSIFSRVILGFFQSDFGLNAASSEQKHSSKKLELKMGIQSLDSLAVVYPLFR
jgi:hypothetical protein